MLSTKAKQLLIALILFAGTASAETWISVGGATDHFCHTCGYNNFNPGLGIQSDYLEIADTKLLAGGYYNSFYKATFYGGMSYQPVQYGIVKFGAVAAVVTNYNNLRVPVMALPVVSVEGDCVGVDILGGPSIGRYNGLITVNFKFKL